MSLPPIYHARSHRANSPDGIPVLVHLKVFDDATAATAGDDARRFVVTDDLDGTRLRSAHFSVTTPSTSGTLLLQVANLTWGTVDLLTTRTSIDQAESSSYTATAQHVVDTTSTVTVYGTVQANYMARGDVLRVDVDAAGTGAMGLEALLEFGPPLVTLT